MRLLPVIIVLSFTLALLVENVNSAEKDDDIAENELLQLEEELYQLTKQDTQKEKKEKVAVNSEKKYLRAPCGFSSCKRRRSSSRRRGSFWGKKSEDDRRHQKAAYSSFGLDEFDQVLSDIETIAKEIKNEKKNKAEFKQKK